MNDTGGSARRPRIGTASSSPILAFIALVVLLAAGCADYVGDDLRSGEALVQNIPPGVLEAGASTTTIPSEPVDIRGLSNGTCFNTSTAEASPAAMLDGIHRQDPVVVIACSEPHTFELIGRKDLGTPEAVWPGEDQIAEDSDGFCFQQFVEVTKTSWAESPLDYLTQVPNEAQWAAEEAEAACVLFEMGLRSLETSFFQPNH